MHEEPAVDAAKEMEPTAHGLRVTNPAVPGCRPGTTPATEVAAEVARRFPGTSAWLGRHTGSWWAITRDRAGADHLVEAATPVELVRRLDGMDVRRAAPRYTRAQFAAPSTTVPDLGHATQLAAARSAAASVPAAPPARPPRERPRRAPRRGWLRSAFGALVAS